MENSSPTPQNNLSDNGDKISDIITGILLGTAVGDSIGLPCEGLSRKRLNRWHKGHLQQCLIGKFGLVSDDTEHTIMLTEAVLASYATSNKLLANSVNISDLFLKIFARKLRYWFIALPAGVGLGTARACIKLWLGFSPIKSGVFSAGNGPAMRSAILGALAEWSVLSAQTEQILTDTESVPDDYKSISQIPEPNALNAWVAAATKITHSDPRAFVASLAVSKVCQLAVQHYDHPKPDISTLSDLLSSLAANDAEWQDQVKIMRQGWDNNWSVAEFADQIGQTKGISGYAYKTVPAAIYCWYVNYGDFRSAIEDIVKCGGDTDTTAAIVGALTGASVGAAKIPVDWCVNLRDYPLSTDYIRKIASTLATLCLTGQVGKMPKFAWYAVLPRNLLFLAVVLCHGFRRLIP